MPIINQVVGTRRRKLGPQDAVRTIEEVQKRDEALYKVRFRNIEQAGGSIGFYYRGHGRTIYQISLTDGEVCELPLGLIMKMRSGCKTPGKPDVFLKDDDATRGGRRVETIDMNSFQLHADGSGMDGKISTERTDLYVLEFVSDELERLERIWEGTDATTSVKQMEQVKQSGGARKVS